MANYDYTSIYPPPQKPTSRVVNRVSVSCSEDTEAEDAKEIRDLARCTQSSSSSNRRQVQSSACPSQTTSMLRRKCNNSNASRSVSVAQNRKNMAHRLIECLFCKCEDGNYARQLLFQFQQKTNEFFPDLEDETFYIYYKILIYTMLFTGLFTVSLSLWHFLF